MAAQIKFHREAEPSDGLRSRKKIKTRVAIEEAALDLVAEQGFDATTVEQIAERAEVSTTTFFRYFPSKADALLAHEGSRVPTLQQAVLDRPREENDLEAISAAILAVWAPEIDAERSKRSCQAFANSPVLRGLHEDMDTRRRRSARQAPWRGRRWPIQSHSAHCAGHIRRQRADLDQRVLQAKFAGHHHARFYDRAAALLRMVIVSGRARQGLREKPLSLLFSSLRH
jgi:AcrR family transcriptional regulator